MNGSCSCVCQPSSNQLIKLTTERIKTLRVIGENTAQVVVENTARIDAVKIDRIIASVKDVTDHVFKNKIVKQGTIHKQVFFVDPKGFVREVGEDIPFMVAVDIAGVEPSPNIDVENTLLNIETDFVLTPAKSREHEHDCELGLLKQKVVADFLVTVSELTQLDVVVKPNVFTVINPLNTIVIRNQ